MKTLSNLTPKLQIQEQFMDPEKVTDISTFKS